MDIISLEEKITRGANYTLSLPSQPDKTNAKDYFTRFYDRMRELCEVFAASDPIRVRSYRCSYKAYTDGNATVIEITLSARIKEPGRPPFTTVRKLSDKWKDGILVSHIRQEETSIQ